MQMRAGVAKKTIKSIRQQAFEQTHLFDSHPESSLDFEKVRAAVKDGYDRPFLLIDSNIIREKARRFAVAMPRVRPHYAVKANPDPRVLKVVHRGGRRFRDRLDRRARPAALARRSSRGDFLLESGEVARPHRLRGREGRRMVRDRLARGAEEDPFDQGGRHAVPADRHAQHRQRLAARRASSAPTPPRCATSSARRPSSRPISRASLFTWAPSAAIQRTGASASRSRAPCSTR